MIEMLLLAVAPIAPVDPQPCIPIISDGSAPTPSAINEHRSLRKALNEPMPQAPTMIMLYGKGGHLATKEYSIVVVRSSNGEWRGTAVGRSQIWVKDAPYNPIGRREWALDRASGIQLDSALARRCPFKRKSTQELIAAGPPPLGSIAEIVDIVAPDSLPYSFYVDDGGNDIAKLVRPPEDPETHALR